MKIVAASILALIGAVSGASFDDELDLVDLAQISLPDAFAQWKLAFGREYDSIADEYARFTIFVDNLQMIAGHNSDGSHTSKMRMNQFGDWTEDEYLDYVNTGFKGGRRHGFKRLSDFVGGDGANPTSVDWREEGVVTPVKNQGQCGSCWAFSTTGSLECRSAIVTQKLISLSEQQLVDCSHAEGNLGCSGGLMDNAFEYVEKSGGLCTETEYPYKARGGTCQSSTCGPMYDPISGYTDVRSDNEADLETAAAAGCVSVAIEADQAAFQFYSSGILTGLCGTSLDHGVLVVGYGVDGSQEYWIVKNSWGTSWGEQGYVRICKDCNKNGSKGECGINMQPSFPLPK